MGTWQDRNAYIEACPLLNQVTAVTESWRTDHWVDQWGVTILDYLTNKKPPVRH